MRDLRLALAQIDTGLGTVTANLEKHRQIVADAVKGNAKLVVFPELSLTGYVLRDQVPELASTLEGETLRVMCEMSREIDIVVGFVEESPEHLFYNAAAYLSGGRVRHVHRKVYLPTYGMFEEGRDFASGGRLRSFESAAGRAGLMICEDAWHPSSAFLLTQQQAQLLFVPSSGPSRGAKPERGLTSVEVWRSLLTVTARFQTSWIIYVNRVGCEDGLIFGGGSMVIDPFGRVTAEAPALEESLLFVDLEAEVLRRARTVYPLIRDANLELVYRESERIRAERYDLPQADES